MNLADTISKQDSSSYRPHHQELKLSIYESSEAIHIFPQDELGIYTIRYGAKIYKFSPTLLRYSQVLRSKLNKDNLDLNINMKYPVSERAFDLVMKLLFGFKDVLIPQKDQIEVFIILSELNIDDKSNFRAKAEENIISRVDNSTAIAAFQASSFLTHNVLLERSLEIIAREEFRPLLIHSDQVNKLSETQFKVLMESHREAKKKEQNSNRFLTSDQVKKVIENYCDYNYSIEKIKERKLSEYLNLFLTIGTDEPVDAFEIVYEDPLFNTLPFEKLMKKQLEIVQCHNVKLDKKLDDVIQENQSLKKEVASLTEKVNLLIQITQANTQQLCDNMESLMQSVTPRSSYGNPMRYSMTAPEEHLFVDNSTLLTNSEYVDLIKLWLPSHHKELRLLYRGTRDGFSAQKFHQVCDNQSPTLSIIKSEQGRIFGGYTQQKWSSPLFSVYREDPNVFLFSLTHQEKYCIKPGQAQLGILANKSWMMLFGGGNDFAISDECNIQEKSYCDFPTSYFCPKFPFKTEESKDYLAGSYEFRVAEIEVFLVL